MKTPINLDVFVRRLHRDVSESGGRYVFFLGAGCSISSGIPAAGKLTKEWADKLAKEEGRPIEEIIPTYDSTNPAASYGEVMNELFVERHLRQEEIERICGNANPGFGYCALATLLGHRDYSNAFRSVLTTNFDDLIAEAFYRYTAVRPLIIDHESLASFVRVEPKVPVVVKLHGDHRLAPQNTAPELEKLNPDVKIAMRKLLEERGIIFIGYSGNDQGVADALDQFEEGRLRRVFWINNGEPGSRLRGMLDKHSATWVKHRDFDHLMLAIQHHFKVSHPNRQRFHAYAKEYVKSLYEVAEKAIVPESILTWNQWLEMRSALVDDDYLSSDGYLIAHRVADTTDHDIPNGLSSAELKMRDRDLAERYKKNRIGN